ncbi:hypothetical protein GE061_014739 [Apolygus lucorum]|uniref:Uncharacterized protein n=1 Tax=Apolygus lucorum TaxID=248454 RepID=A0A8S9XLT2_APOLU|nr:hypothetical protein GE061_014739 [Apolygus lucorum]
MWGRSENENRFSGTIVTSAGVKILACSGRKTIVEEDKREKESDLETRTSSGLRPLSGIAGKGVDSCKVPRRCTTASPSWVSASLDEA